MPPSVAVAQTALVTFAVTIKSARNIRSSIAKSFPTSVVLAFHNSIVAVVAVA